MIELFTDWIVPVSVQLIPLGLFVALADRMLAGRVRVEWRAALWAVLFVKLVLPTSLSSAWSPTALFPQPLASLYAATELTSYGAGRWLPVAFTCWAIGLVAVTTLSLVRALRFSRRTRVTSPADERLLQLATRVGEAIGLRKLPPLRVSSTVTGPVVHGLFRPRILLPAQLAMHADKRELEHILAHELSHVRRFDPLRGFVLHALHTVFWFHPVVWFAHRQLDLFREQSCDLEAARATGSASAYRRTLLDLTARIHGLSPSAGLRFLPGRRILPRLQNLEQLARHESREQREFRPAPLHSALATLLLALCSLPVSRAELAEDWLSTSSLEDLPGCLPARMLVLRELAKEQAHAVR